MVYTTAVFQPNLSAAHRAARCIFAANNANTNWARVMFTDSKYFQLHPPKKGRAMRSWTPAGQRRVLPAIRNSQQVHVYAGVTQFGVTKLLFVTGTTGQASPFTNSRNNSRYSGVCQQEYQQIIAPHLIAEGHRLFANTAYRDNWVFQQDGARVHTAISSVQYIQASVGGGVLRNWPANSPDLSWIENIWAWAEGELRRRPLCSNVEELKRVLNEIWEDLEQNHAHILRNCVVSMPRRMRRVTEHGGGHIGN